MMKSAVGFTGVLFLLPTMLWGAMLAPSSVDASSSMQQRTRILQRTELPPYPTGRFVPWDILTDTSRTAAEDVLEYTMALWNDFSLDPPVEAFNYGALTAAQVVAVSTAMGIGGPNEDPDVTEETWDCWINHYNNYDWSEMGADGADVQGWWEVLGWNQAMWDEGVGAPPPSDDLIWAELSDAQREAAGFLCYEELSWDGLDLATLFTAAPTHAPTTGAPTVDGTTPKPTTTMPTTTPTATLTMSPTDAYKVAPSIPLRYDTEWTELPTNVQGVLETDFGYTESTWNIPSTNDVEDAQWDSLSTAQQTTLTDTLSWTTDMWNCHVNHYTDFDWQGLNDEGVQQFWVALGWSELSWLGQADEPATETADWSELNGAEQAAAAQLCYFANLWDGNVDLGSSTPSAAPTTGAPTTFLPSGVPVGTHCDLILVTALSTAMTWLAFSR